MEQEEDRSEGGGVEGRAYKLPSVMDDYIYTSYQVDNKNGL